MTPLSAFDYHRTLERHSSDALVVFTGPGCGACRALKRALSQLSPADAPALFEVDVARWPGLAEELEVFHLPAMFLYRGGEYWAPIHAVARPAALLAAIREAAGRPAEEPP